MTMMLLKRYHIVGTEFVEKNSSLRINLIFGTIQKLAKDKSDEHILEPCWNAKPVFAN